MVGCFKSRISEDLTGHIQPEDNARLFLSRQFALFCCDVAHCCYVDQKYCSLLIVAFWVSICYQLLEVCFTSSTISTIYVINLSFLPHPREKCHVSSFLSLRLKAVNSLKQMKMLQWWLNGLICPPFLWFSVFVIHILTFFFPCLDAYSKRWGFEGISCIEKFLVKMLRCSNTSRLVLWFAEHSSRNNTYFHHLWHVWKKFTIYYSWFIYLVVLPCCINVRH